MGSQPFCGPVTFCSGSFEPGRSTENMLLIQKCNFNLPIITNAGLRDEVGLIKRLIPGIKRLTIKYKS